MPLSEQGERYRSRREQIVRTMRRIDMLADDALDMDDEARLIDAKLLLIDCFEAIPNDFSGQTLEQIEARVAYKNSSRRKKAA